jgi:hypothetical protein
VELSRYSLDIVREDAEFILYRAHSKQIEPPSILLLTPSSTRPSPETLEKINHEYALSSELDNIWALLPLAISSYNDRRVLVLEDPGAPHRHHDRQDLLAKKTAHREQLYSDFIRESGQPLSSPQGLNVVGRMPADGTITADPHDG